MKQLSFVALCCLVLFSCEGNNQNDTIAKNGLLIFFVLAMLCALYRWTRAESLPKKDAIYDHHYYSFENFQISSKEFYEELQSIITEKEFPNVEAKVIQIPTAFFSADREYLEVKFKEMVFYVCAAPFGKNFFISYRLGDVPEGCTTVFSRKVFGFREHKSFYRIDIELMFKKGIEAAVTKAIKSVTEKKGLRILTTEEQVPKTY